MSFTPALEDEGKYNPKLSSKEIQSVCNYTTKYKNKS